MKNRRIENSKFNSTFISKIILIVMLLSVFSLLLTACDDAEVIVKSGTVTAKEYGNPIYEKRGNVSFRIAGYPDYFIKVEDEENFQWFRVLDQIAYITTEVGGHFEYNPQYFKAVNNFLDRS